MAGNPGPTTDLRPIRHHSDAEHNAAVTLRRLGFADAQATGPGNDGGVDVRGSGIVAQVKAETAPVGILVVQALFGCAAAEGATGAFFSISGFTSHATGWANMAGLALFDFDLLGNAVPLNSAAVDLSPAATYLDEAAAYEGLVTDVLQRSDELAHLWRLPAPGQVGCLIGLVDRVDEAERWARALAVLLATRAQTKMHAVDPADVKIIADVAWAAMNAESGDVVQIARADLVPVKFRNLLAEYRRKWCIEIPAGATRIAHPINKSSLVMTVPRGWAADSAKLEVFEPDSVVRLPIIRSFVSPGL